MIQKGVPIHNKDDRNNDKGLVTQDSSPSATSGFVISRYRSDFEEIEFLGKGGFGEVVKARNRLDGRVYAIKKVKLDPKDSEYNKKILREVTTLSRLHHEYVVRYYQAWFEEAESKEGKPEMSYKMLYIQMQYCEKKTLRNVIDEGLLTEEESWKYFRQLLEGLAHIHSQGMIHRDLKPSNVFLDENDDVKIGDFGLAITNHKKSRNTMTENYLLTGNIGTTFYVSPEVLKNKNTRYSQKVDMYSLGIILFEMLYKMETGMERAKILENIRKDEIIFPDDFNTEKYHNQTEIIRLLLSHDPKKRPTSFEILQSDLLPPKMEGI
ncbi:kinase-like protein [Neocallimastix californiae]|uniref:non-specific serine/threonine protein kinase n=1 Tax=Neocallimastix californiae TaxID=1754190 RepID=A0A1Y2AW12_9FUNG|nr:kinase-like protein [Neocallimastix californiae]|eukprot:ORY26095.1 kinase-like protein [Neocallimastix californiae]